MQLELKKMAFEMPFENWLNESVKEIASYYPNVSLKSFSDFNSWLNSVIPKLIHKYMIATKSMKVCSTISADFAEIAADKGFPVGVLKIPGHHFNVAFTSDGLYKIDLSAIQFVCKHDITDRKNRKEVIENYKKLYNDPFSAIEVNKMPSKIIDFEFPGVSANNIFNPVESFNKYDPKLMEEDDYWFDKLKQCMHKE